MVWTWHSVTASVSLDVAAGVPLASSRSHLIVPVMAMGTPSDSLHTMPLTVALLVSDISEPDRPADGVAGTAPVVSVMDAPVAFASTEPDCSTVIDTHEASDEDPEGVAAVGRSLARAWAGTMIAVEDAMAMDAIIAVVRNSCGMRENLVTMCILRLVKMTDRSRSLVGRDVRMRVASHRFGFGDTRSYRYLTLGMGYSGKNVRAIEMRNPR